MSGRNALVLALGLLAGGSFTVIGQACRDWDGDAVCDYGGPAWDTGDTGW